jgi:hypothetical protein
LPVCCCLSTHPHSLGHIPDATSAHPPLQALAAVEAVELSTRYSRSCCKLMVENGGFSALLLFVRGCNRSKPHVEMLKRILAILAHVCRYPELVRGVFESDDCVSILSERLQFFRDIEASCGLCTSTHIHTHMMFGSGRSSSGQLMDVVQDVRLRTVFLQFVCLSTLLTIAGQNTRA